MTFENINKLYFKWICQLVCNAEQIKEYSKLLNFLHSVEFNYILSMDENRLEDGLNLRYRFAFDKHLDSEIVYSAIDEPCSVLEMMAALALKCEEDIMSNLDYGDRTGIWFWTMIDSLGLIDMTNDLFDLDNAEIIISKFLERDYERNGQGGLFTVRNAPMDMRDAEIWMQMNWYIDPIA